MTTEAQLSRVINLVPYLLARPGIQIETAANDLGITVSELRDDLTLLWMCGLPGYGPGDLIDIAFDDDTVTVTYDAGMTRPVRLLPDEAIALIVALQMLADTPGLSDRGIVQRTIDKIAAAAGDAAEAVSQVRVHETVYDGDISTYKQIVASAKAVRLTYYSAGRDVSSERIVDPVRVVIVDNHAYLQAWCRTAEDVRRFRLDRIDACTVLDEPSEAPDRARGNTDLPAAVFSADDTHMPQIAIRVGRAARWIWEYYPCESIEADSDGHWIITMRARDLEWATRFVLGLGTDVEAVSPPQLREAVAEQARSALAGYEQDL